VDHFFEDIIIRQEEDTPNWTLKDSGNFTLKSTRKFFMDPEVPCGWGKIIWSKYIPPSKTLVLWKLFHGWLPTDQHIQHIGLHICSICTLCEKLEESIQHLFFNILMLCIFGDGFNKFFLMLIL